MFGPGFLSNGSQSLLQSPKASIMTFSIKNNFLLLLIFYSDTTLPQFMIPPPPNIFPPITTFHRLKATGDVWLEWELNNNGNDFLLVGLHPGYPLKRSLLKFEDIPSSCEEVVTATMHVYYQSAYKASFCSESQVPWIPRPIEARQVLKNWSEHEATPTLRFTGMPWGAPYLDVNNVDASSHILDIQTISRDTNSSYISWNVTISARNWRAGQPNNGILLLAANEDVFGRVIRFPSHEYGWPGVPYLELICKSEYNSYNVIYFFEISRLLIHQE